MKAPIRQDLFTKQQRAFLAQNLRNAIRHRFPDEDYEGWTPKAIALSKLAGVGKSTILRAIDESEPTGLNTANLSALAHALGFHPYQLLIPYLNIENPQKADPEAA